LKPQMEQREAEATWIQKPGYPCSLAQTPQSAVSKLLTDVDTPLALRADAAMSEADKEPCSAR
jgi:hypothetical protein